MSGNMESAAADSSLVYWFTPAPFDNNESSAADSVLVYWSPPAPRLVPAAGNHHPPMTVYPRKRIIGR